MNGDLDLKTDFFGSDDTLNILREYTYLTWLLVIACYCYIFTLTCWT